jgi:hypothetical protein
VSLLLKNTIFDFLYNIAYHALLSFRRDPGSNPACGRYFFAEILRNSYIPVKRINIIMVTSIFLEKYINKICPTCRRIKL